MSRQPEPFSRFIAVERRATYELIAASKCREEKVHNFRGRDTESFNGVSQYCRSVSAPDHCSRKSLVECHQRISISILYNPLTMAIHATLDHSV